MSTTKRWKFLLFLSLMGGVPMLSGCGEAPKQPQAPLVRGVLTTAADCAGLGTLSVETCAKAIEMAVAEHEAHAPSYPSLKVCEKAEGVDKCERTDTKGYRPRLMAFIVTMTDPPVAAPLYPTPKGEAGFRTANNSLLLSEDESLTFSRPARAAAEMQASKGGGGYKF